MGGGYIGRAPVSRSDSSRKYNTLLLLKETVAPIRYNTPIYIYVYI
jgi:hypothetical protein